MVDAKRSAEMVGELGVPFRVLDAAECALLGESGRAARGRSTLREARGQAMMSPHEGPLRHRPVRRAAAPSGLAPPELARFNAGRWASDVVATPDGKWVFALLRLRNTVVSLRHDAGAPASSALMPVSEAPTGAETPRQCVLEVVSDAIVLLYIAHHHGHAVTRVVCYLDEGRAGLMEDGVVVADAPLASCVCVL